MVFVYIKIYIAAKTRMRKKCLPTSEDEQLMKGKPKRVLLDVGPGCTAKENVIRRASAVGGNNDKDTSPSNIDGITVWREPLAANSKENLVDDSTSYSKPLRHCTKLKPTDIFKKLKLGRSLSKDDREVIDTGVRIKIVSLQAAEENVAVSIEREKKRLARQKERRATLILGLIMGSFIACWLPFFMIYLIGPVCPICDDGCAECVCCVPASLFSIAFWLGYSNSALNPVIYTVFNKDFRKAFKKILFKF